MREVDGDDASRDDLRAELLRLGTHFLHQVRAHDALPVPGPVVDHRGDHQLTAGIEPFDHQRMEVRPRRVQRGGQAGRTRPDDHDRQDVVIHRCFSINEES